MSEIIRKFSDVISDKRLAELSRRFIIDDDDDRCYFRTNDFINGYSIVEYGYEYEYECCEQNTNIINANGDFVEIKLNDDIKYSNGDIVKLNDTDKGKYAFSIHRILELDSNDESSKRHIVLSGRETSFFYIKVTRYPQRRDEATKDMFFVINPDLKVIANFIDVRKYGVDFDGYENCVVYTERKFFFIDDTRRFIAFTQKLMVDSDEEGFFDEHMYGLAPELYDEQMEEYDPDYNVYDPYDDVYAKVYECDLDEETLNKAIEKTNGTINDDEDDNDDDIPYIDDIIFFYDDPNNSLYKEAFNEYYKELFGIIDCRIPAEKQLLPFTDSMDYALHIINDRLSFDKQNRDYLTYRAFRIRGWSFNNENFYGYVLNKRFFDYPIEFRGFTLKYVSTYYPKTLKNFIEQEVLVIPNKLLDDLGDNELTRCLKMEQEKHLNYTSIASTEDPIMSDEKYGIISSYQGQTLRQIIYSKGGTRYIVNLIEYSELQINKSVLTELINSTSNKVEKKCYDIILSVIIKIEEEAMMYKYEMQKKCMKILLEK